MKRNFFKKLSFVMALAMMISVIAPAASAFGATSPSLYVTKKYLYLNEEGKASDYDFNIKNKVAGSTYAWASDNEAIAVVDEATGLATAKAVGTANVTCTITFKTGKTKALKAAVVVRDNIETIDVVQPGTDYVVGTEYDFNRSFVTFNGSSKKTSSISRWSIDKGTIAADSGKVTFAEAGEYNVTVSAFQSTAQYEAAATPLATKTVKIVVSASVVSTVQADADTFKVTFDSDMSKTDIKTASVLYQVINGKNVSTGTEKIKAVTLDTTGKVATIDMYAAFTAKTVYNYAFGKLTGTFTAATKDIKDIAGIVFDDFSATVGTAKDMLGSVKAVNKDGVVILGGADISGYLTFTYGGDTLKGNTSGKDAYIYTSGYSATVTVKFANYVYDETTKAYKAVTFEDAAVATGITANAATASTLQFDMTTSNAQALTDSTWKGSLTVPAGETHYIHVRYYTSDNSTSYTYKYNNSPFVYESTDTSKLLVTGNQFYPVSAGTVTVMVKQNSTIVATFDVVVTAARTFASATQDVASMTLGNNDTVGETKNVVVTVLDSLGGKISNPGVTPEIVNKPVGGSLQFGAITYEEGKITLPITAHASTPGAYNVKIKLSKFNVDKEVYVTVLVLDGNSATATGVSSWAVETNTANVDLNKTYDKDVRVDVYGYNSNGVRVATLTPGTHYTVSVKNSSNSEVASGSNVIAVVQGTSGTTTKVAYFTTNVVGTYTVVVSLTQAGVDAYFANSGRAAGSYFGAVAFSVTDTAAKSFAIETAYVSGASVLAMAKEALKVSLNGTELNDSTITAVKYSVGAAPSTDGAQVYTTAGLNIYIQEVTVQVIDPATSNQNGYIEYTYSVGVTVAVK